MSQITDSPASRRALLGGALGVGGALGLASGAQAATTPIPTDPSSGFFLALTGVAGDSVDEMFRGAIEVLAWSFGSHPGTRSSTSGAATTTYKPVDLTVVARSSRATPKLFGYCLSGKRLTGATLSAQRQTGEPYVYQTVKLEKVNITSYDVATSETDGFPLDVVRLSYVTIVDTFYTQNPDGSLTPTSWGFDFSTGRQI